MAELLPRYVERGGEIVPPHPYSANNARTYVFLLPADLAKLQDMFDRFFKAPSGGAVEVRASVPVVVLTVSRIGALQSTDPPYSELGCAAETEVAVWVPGVHLAGERLIWFHPYLFVDQHLALASGREIYGFRKQMGRIGIEGPERTPSLMSLSVFTLPRFGPDQVAGEHPLVDVRRGGSGLFAALPEAWSTLTQTVEGFTGVLATLGAGSTASLVAGTARDFLAGVRPILFLKQFRDVAQPDRACHQAIVESRARLVRFHGAGLLRHYTVTVHDLAGEPLRDELGLPPGPLEPLAALWVHTDFAVDLGTELWSARP